MGKGITIDIKVENNKIAEVIEEMKEKAMRGLLACGQEAEGYAKGDCPVDTGRLRNSITFATKEFHSAGNDKSGAKAEPDDTEMRSTPDELTLYVGTNVEYAEKQEYGDYKHKVGKKHFLRDSMSNHSDHYKSILEASLKS
jgi:plastocyanin